MSFTPWSTQSKKPLAVLGKLLSALDISFLKIRMGRVNGGEPRLERRIDQERVHSRPVPLVILLLWQAYAEVVCLIGQIQLVEPVAGVAPSARAMSQ